HRDAPQRPATRKPRVRLRDRPWPRYRGAPRSRPAPRGTGPYAAATRAAADQVALWPPAPRRAPRARARFPAAALVRPRARRKALRDAGSSARSRTRAPGRSAREWVHREWQSPLAAVESTRDRGRRDAAGPPPSNG